MSLPIFPLDCYQIHVTEVPGAAPGVPPPALFPGWGSGMVLAARSCPATLGRDPDTPGTHQPLGPVMPWH